MGHAVRNGVHARESVMFVREGSDVETSLLVLPRCQPGGWRVCPGASAVPFRPQFAHLCNGWMPPLRPLGAGAVVGAGAGGGGWPPDPVIALPLSPRSGFLDWVPKKMQRVGCVELLNTVQRRVQPRLHVFGHIHEGRWGVGEGGLLAGPFQGPPRPPAAPSPPPRLSPC